MKSSCLPRRVAMTTRLPMRGLMALHGVRLAFSPEIVRGDTSKPLRLRWVHSSGTVQPWLAQPTFSGLARTTLRKRLEVSRGAALGRPERGASTSADGVRTVR